MARGRAQQDHETAVDTQPEFASVEDRDVDVDRGGRVRPVRRARLGVVVLTVLVTQLVLIAAGVNEGVAKQLSSYASNHPSSLLGHFVRSLLVFRWSVAPSGHADLWHTELITIGLVLLLGIVLVPMVVHGPVSWLRAFLGTWFTVTVSVVVATVAALVLSDLEESRDLARYVIPGTPSTGLSVGDKIGDAAFGAVPSYAFVAGLALGLVVALVSATVVVSTRRTDPVPVAVAPESGPAYAPDAPQPFFGNAEDDRPTRTAGYGTGAYDNAGYGTARYADTHAYASPDRRAENATTTLPAVGAGYAAGASESTTTLPRLGPDSPSTTGSTAADSGSTSELPRTEAVPVAGPSDTDEARSDEARSDEARSDEARSHEARTGEARTGEARTDEARTDEAESTQAWPAQPESARSEADAERTTAFPMPPDDEGLEHQPYHNED